VKAAVSRTLPVGVSRSSPMPIREFSATATASRRAIYGFTRTLRSFGSGHLDLDLIVVDGRDNSRVDPAPLFRR